MPVHFVYQHWLKNLLRHIINGWSQVLIGFEIPRQATTFPHNYYSAHDWAPAIHQRPKWLGSFWVSFHWAIIYVKSNVKERRHIQYIFTLHFSSVPSLIPLCPKKAEDSGNNRWCAVKNFHCKWTKQGIYARVKVNLSQFYSWYICIHHVWFGKCFLLYMAKYYKTIFRKVLMKLTCMCALLKS